jgi:nucleotide-binding universal stress UspA family protein
LGRTSPEEVAEAAAGALAGLLGRGRPHPGRHPAERINALSGEAAAEMLAEAAARLGRQARQDARSGRVERVVVELASGADLLVAARDGDRSRLGPGSLGPATRFVVDHAPCPVLLVWPDEAPGVESIPPPPRHRGPPPPHPPPHGAR